MIIMKCRTASRKIESSMEVKHAKDRLKRLLVESGFDRSKPIPILGWTVFKKFAYEPVRCAGDSVYAQIGMTYPVNASPYFQVSFVRGFFIKEEPGDYARGESLHLDFACDLTAEPKTLPAYLRSETFPNLESFFTAVERLPEFQQVLSIRFWTCSIYQDKFGYQIISKLAKKKETTVYKARDIRFNRNVALKISGPTEPGHMERLFRSARCMAAVQHSGTVAAFGVGENQGDIHIAMELVEGGTLADKLGKPWPARTAAQFIADLADAVRALHQQGIIHRDINPTHILLTEDGRPKLTGFRWSLFMDATPDPGLVGIPGYISPQQATGKGNPGPATDIYALGAVLYELLTGRPPFREATAYKTLQKVMEEDPLPPSCLEPNIPADLEAVCLKCLAKRPEDRHETTLGLRDDLRRYLHLTAPTLLDRLRHKLGR